MCGTCGCSTERRSVVVEVHDAILAANDAQAAHNREHFDAARTLAINLMGSPGSGKTALLEATAAALGGRRSIAAMSGDLATERDAERLRAAGIPAAGITTGSACHLDAEMVHEALHHELADPAELLFIENVGNLVCPAIFDLGETLAVVALAVTEGEDKPLKYPVIFQRADLVVLTKTDLLPHLDGVDIEIVRRHLEQVAPGTPLLPLSARTGSGIGAWIEWLESRRRAFFGSAAALSPAAKSRSVPHHALTALIATWCITALAWNVPAAGQPRPTETAVGTATIEIPRSIRSEHEAIHSALVEATQAPGRVGAAAKELAEVLHPHFVREEQIALPPLGLLASLASGAPVPERVQTAALAMTDALRSELPRMMEEHERIRAAVGELRLAARAEHAAKHEELADELALHARTEEEVLYPAAVLVGDLLRARPMK